MNEKEKTRLLARVIRLRGKHQQLIKAVEELSELATVLARAANGDEHLSSIEEEIADVEIMLGQVKNIYRSTDSFIDQRIESWKEDKLDRLKFVLDQEEAENVK